MSNTLYILDTDKLWLNNRINELEKQIQDLGPDFYDVFNQSSETWHDNAPFDALRDKQSVLFAEFSKLKVVRRDASIAMPKSKKGFVNYGSRVIIDGKIYSIAGDWTPHAGTRLKDAIIVSAQSPLGKSALGKKAGDTTPFGIIEKIIET